MIRELLGLDFSTERIKEFDKNQNVETTKTLLTEELNIVNQNIVELFEKRISIEARIKSLEENMNHTDLENIRLKNFEERHCVMISESNLDDDDVDYYLVKYMQSHKNKVDTIGACDCYVLDTSKVNDEDNSYITKGVFSILTHFYIIVIIPFLPESTCLFSIKVHLQEPNREWTS